MTTLSQIAREAGVTEMTVSNILNGKNKENRPSSIKRASEVRAIAARLGYRPNAAARAVASGKFGAYGLLISSDPLRGNIFNGTWHGLFNALNERGLRLVVGDADATRFAETDYVPRLLSEWSVDGLIVNYTSDVPETVRERLVTERVPTVFTNICLNADCVYPDDEGAARQATEYLLSLGHTRIAYANFLDENLSIHYSRRARRAGYEAAIRDAGVAPQFSTSSGPPDSVHAWPGGWLPLAAAVLDKPASERPTAVFTYGIHEALSLMYAAAARGIQVPRDLSIIGVYDNIVDHPGVRVSTMIIPAVALGEAAVRMLDRKIVSGGEAQPPQPIPFKLDAGETCAPPRSP